MSPAPDSPILIISVLERYCSNETPTRGRDVDWVPLSFSFDVQRYRGLFVSDEPGRPPDLRPSPPPISSLTPFGGTPPLSSSTVRGEWTTTALDRSYPRDPLSGLSPVDKRVFLPVISDSGQKGKRRNQKISGSTTKSLPCKYPLLSFLQ